METEVATREEGVREAVVAPVVHRKVSPGGTLVKEVAGWGWEAEEEVVAGTQAEAGAPVAHQKVFLEDTLETVVAMGGNAPRKHVCDPQRCPRHHCMVLRSQRLFHRRSSPTPCWIDHFPLRPRVCHPPVATWHRPTSRYAHG